MTEGIKQQRAAAASSGSNRADEWETVRITPWEERSLTARVESARETARIWNTRTGQKRMGESSKSRSGDELLMIWREMRWMLEHRS